MINNPINVSKFNGPPPASIYDSRIICDGPIYCREEWLALAKAKKLNFWTRDSARDAANLSLSAGDIADLLVLALEQGRFRGSQWCRQRPDGPWAACDAYTVTRREWNEYAHKEIETTYYLKAAISKAGTLLFSASNHLEGT